MQASPSRTDIVQKCLPLAFHVEPKPVHPRYLYRTKILARFIPISGKNRLASPKAGSLPLRQSGWKGLMPSKKPARRTAPARGRSH
jgi:hypothetical protein